MIKLIISCLNVSFKKLIVWLQLHPKLIASDYLTNGRPLGRRKGVHSCVTPQGAWSGGSEAWLANLSSLTYFNTNGWVSGLGKTSWYEYIGRTVALLKPPQSPHCHFGVVDHAKKFTPSPPLATRQAWSYHANWATQTLLFSKRFDLAQVCHGNKICSKPALTWKLTLVLAFPAHCILN